MKKILCIILSLMIFSSALTVLGAETPTISLVCDDTVMSEESFDVYVTITENSAVAGGRVTIGYDNTVLEIVSVSAETLLSGASLVPNTAYTESSSRISWAGTTGLTNGGNLMKITFKAKAVEEDVLTSISIIESKVTDEKTNVIAATTVNSAVTVKAPIPAEEVAAGTCGTNATWLLDSNGVLTVSGTGSMTNYTSTAAKPWDEYEDRIEKIVVANGIIRVGNYAFSGLSNVKSVTIGKGVTTISVYAFKDCTSLTEVNMSNYVETISTGAFYLCTKLESVVIPDSVTTMGTLVFQGCTNLKNAVIGSGVTAIPDKTFNLCSNLETVTFSKGVTSIGASAFNSCSALKTVYFNGTEEQWGNITVGSSNASLANATVVYESATVVKGVTLDKTELELTLDEVVTVTATATPVTPVTWSTSDETVATVDENGKITAVGIGEAVITATTVDGNYSASCIVTVSNITSIASGVCGTNAIWSLDNAGVLTVSGTGSMTNYTSTAAKPWDEYEEQIKKIVVEDGIVRVGNYAFSGLSKVESVTIGKGVTTISVYAFRDCVSLTEVNMSNYVDTISTGAFYLCTGLESIVIPDSVTTMGTLVFYGCTELDSVVLGSGLTSINDKMFNLCSSLKTVTFSNSITSIGLSAFGSCNALETVNFHGIEKEWNNITVESGNDALDDASIVFDSLPDVNVTGISVDTEELTLKVGESASVTATVTPDDATDTAVVWSTSDAAVATVDGNGKIVATGIGKATVTVTTVDGGYTASCVVTVEALNGDEVEVEVGTVKGKVGAIVDIPVSISKNTGIAGFNFTVKYDKTLLAPVDIFPGEVIENAGNFTSNIDEKEEVSGLENVTATWYSPVNVAEDGVLFYVSFEIIGGSEGDSIPVSASCEAGNISNEDLENMTVVFTEGGIEIISVIVGDVYADNVVNTKDSVRLSQHLAGWSIELSNYELEAADICSDGVINIKDIIKLSQYLAGIEPDLMSLFDATKKNVAFEVGEANIVDGYLEVPVLITENDGIAGFRLQMNYDSSSLVPVDVEHVIPEGAMMNSLDEGVECDGVAIMWYSIEETDYTGEAFIVRFEMTETIEEEAIIQLTCNEGEVCDVNCNDMIVKLADGRIALK